MEPITNILKGISNQPPRSIEEYKKELGFNDTEKKSFSQPIKKDDHENDLKMEPSGKFGWKHVKTDS